MPDYRKRRRLASNRARAPRVFQRPHQSGAEDEALPLDPQDAIEDEPGGGEELAGEEDEDDGADQARHAPGPDDGGEDHLDLRLVDGQDQGQSLLDAPEHRLVGQEEAAPGDHEEEKGHDADDDVEGEAGGEEEAVEGVEDAECPPDRARHYRRARASRGSQPSDSSVFPDGRYSRPT